MATIQIHSEQESNRGWSFAVRVEDDGDIHDYDVTLSWADYDLWSRGQVAPEKVVRAAFEFLLDREPPTAILQKFDCAVIRRYFPEVDKEIGSFL